METHYEILDIQPNATLEQIKAAWKRSALQDHPDHGDENGEATERFKKITAAYKCLSDPDKRKAYDATLRSSGPKAMGHTPQRRPSQTTGHPGSIQPWIDPGVPTVRPKASAARVILLAAALGGVGLLAASAYAPKDASGHRRDRRTGRYRSGPFW